MMRVRWTQSVAGERPGLLLGDGLVLLYTTPTAGSPHAPRLTCFDLEGNALWSRAGLVGLLALPGNRFLATTATGDPLILDAAGEVARQRVAGRVTDAVRHGDILLLAGERRVWAADLDLTPLWDVPWPNSGAPALGCFVDDALYWTHDDSKSATISCLRCIVRSICCNSPGSARSCSAIFEMVS